MYLLCKVFLWNKKWKLFLLAGAVAIIGLLYFYTGILKKSLEDRITIREIGPIPSFTLMFNKDLKKDEINSLVHALQDKMDIDYIRKGYKHRDKISFQWDKSTGIVVRTSFDLNLIGWDLEQTIDIIVKAGGVKREVRCPEMDPVDGFFVPEKIAKSLGEEITIEKAVILNSGRTYGTELDLPAMAESDPERIGSKIYRRYDIPKPKGNEFNKKVHDAYKKLMEKYSLRISQALSAPLGYKMWMSLQEDTKKNIYRLYKDESVAMPSIQIWEDICGASLQTYSPYKDLWITEEHNQAPLKYRMEFYGKYRTRYRSDVNGYILLCNLKWLMGHLNKGDNVYNLLEIEVPFSNPKEGQRDQLKNFLIKKGFQQDDFQIIPWWELANKESVDFILRIQRHLSWFSILMILFGIFAFFQMGYRFAGELHSDWNGVRPFSSTRANSFLIGICHIFSIVFMAILFAYVGALIVNEFIMNPILYRGFLEPVSMDKNIILKASMLIFFTVGVIYLATLWLYRGREHVISLEHSNEKGEGDD